MRAHRRENTRKKPHTATPQRNSKGRRFKALEVRKIEMTDTSALSHQDRIQRAVAIPAFPHIYFNSFVIVIGTADVAMALECNGTPVCVLNMSYTTAKSLAEKTGEIVQKLEHIAGRKIMTTDFLKNAVTKNQKNMAAKK